MSRARPPLLLETGAARPAASAGALAPGARGPFGPARLRPPPQGRRLVRMTEALGPRNMTHAPAETALLWGTSALAVAALLGAALWLASRNSAAPDGPASTPPAIMIELAPEIAAPEVEEEGTDNAPEAAEQAEQQEQPEPEVEPEPEVVPEEPVEEPPEITEPVEEPPPPEEPQEPPPEEIVEPEPEPEPEPEVPAEQDPVDELPPSLAPLVALSPPSRPTPPPPPPAPRQQTAPSTAAAPSAQSAPRQVNAPPAEVATATQNVVSETAPNISPQQWQSRVLSHLDRYKRYPDAARAARQQGQPRIRITIDPSGRVLDVTLSASSGFPLLDEAALDMARRASPLPAPPASVAQPRLTMTVPVNFRIR